MSRSTYFDRRLVLGDRSSQGFRVCFARGETSTSAMPPRTTAEVATSVTVTGSPEPGHRAQRGQRRHRELHRRRMRGTQTGQRRIPDRVANARRERARGDRTGQADGIECDPSRHGGDKHQPQRRQTRPAEVPGGYRERVDSAAAAQRIDAPGHTGAQHRDRAPPGRRLRARQQQRDQPGASGNEAGGLQSRETLAAAQPLADHRDLHRAEEQQRAGRCAQAHVGPRKARGIDEECGAAEPVPAVAP
jgi:hypothetical protein